MKFKARLYITFASIAAVPIVLFTLCFIVVGKLMIRLLGNYKRSGTTVIRTELLKAFDVILMAGWRGLSKRVHEF